MIERAVILRRHRCSDFAQCLLHHAFALPVGGIGAQHFARLRDPLRAFQSVDFTAHHVAHGHTQEAARLRVVADESDSIGREHAVNQPPGRLAHSFRYPGIEAMSDDVII